MKAKVLFLGRKPSQYLSIEKIFEQIARNLSAEKFEVIFQNVLYYSDILGIVKNLLFFRKIEAEIYHITGHIHYMALVLPAGRTVLTIHDAGILHIRKGLRRYILKKLYFELPIKKLNFVTAVSEATKKEIIFHTNCLPEKIRVIENPIQEHFFSTEQKEFNSQCPTILQIGTRHNKNPGNLIKALHGINCLLILVGELEEETIKLLGENKIRFENKLNLSDSAIRKEYEETDIVTFCSTFEGFGLPIIEAQAMRKPVITSDISPLKEVAGAGALLADPHSVSSIREGVLQIINNKEYRESLIKHGLVNVKRFQPELITESYENLYQEVLNARRKSQNQK